MFIELWFQILAGCIIGGAVLVYLGYKLNDAHRYYSRLQRIKRFKIKLNYWKENRRID